ncbi:hypothetical protein GGQ84_002032 [Desulfitispora alkaliphila]|uniref:pyrimidine dimer DNA glycosylase/endonuclease V n=1 Tax=Desulfitispora alkaliphila TaxID=622674 RepID=UPI003D249281
MRLWSIHPKYLDAKGLVALWREALLAQKVLMGKTKGYTKHPQLKRFRDCGNPQIAINTYLYYVQAEATKRNYNFDSSKIGTIDLEYTIEVTEGQLQYELSHLLKKLALRDKDRYELWKDIELPDTHPLFISHSGEIASWEIT